MATAYVSGSGCCCETGRAFKLTAEERSKAFESLKKIVSENGFANIEEKRQWKVYQAMKPGNPWPHHSLVFQDAEKENAFFVHIIVDRGQVVFEAKSLSTQLVFTLLGNTMKTAKELLNTALERAKKHGDFTLSMNNCQTYCSNLAVDVGVNGYRTDQGKVIVNVGIVSGVALAIAGVAALVGAVFASK